MPIATITSRAFDQDACGAKKAARNGPVFITDRGKPAHVLLTIEDYEKLAGGRASIVARLGMTEADDVAFEAPRLRSIAAPADLSCASCSTPMSFPSVARPGMAAPIPPSSPRRNLFGRISLHRAGAGARRRARSCADG